MPLKGPLQRRRRLQDDDPWAGMNDPFSDLKVGKKEDTDDDEEEEEVGPALAPAFLSASKECFDLQLNVQGALVLQDTCRTNGPAFVQARIGKTTLSTKKTSSGSSTPMWSEVLSFGCQTPEEPLQIKLFTAGGNVECGTWTTRDWLAQSAANPLAVKGTGDVAANTLVLPRWDARVSLMISLASFAHPKSEGSKGWGMLGGQSKQDVVLGGVFAALGLLMIIAISICCCCCWCCPRYYQAHRRRWGLGWGAASASSVFSATTIGSAAPVTIAAMANPPPAQRRPASVPRPPAAAPASRRPSPPPPPYASAPSAPAAHGTRPVPPASLYGELPPVAPAHYSAPIEAVAVAMPIAEPIDGALGNTYRGGYAEARIMRAESGTRVAGNGNGKNGGGGGKR